MFTEIEELHKRVDMIEIQKDQEVLALVEILSNATFFGGIRKANCKYAKNGQCSYFILESEAKNKIPIATECLIKGCKEPSLHYHLEISNMSCTLCQKEPSGPEKHSSRYRLNKSKGTLQDTEKPSPIKRSRIEARKK